MAISGGVELLVTPEVLNKQAVEVEKRVKNMEKRFQNIKELSEKSKNYWLGEAGDMHRKNYANQEKYVEQVLNRLNEHPRDLRVIAQTYSSTELKIEEAIIQELPGDVL